MLITLQSAQKTILTAFCLEDSFLSATCEAAWSRAFGYLRAPVELFTMQVQCNLGTFSSNAHVMSDFHGNSRFPKGCFGQLLGSVRVVRRLSAPIGVVNETKDKSFPLYVFSTSQNERAVFTQITRGKDVSILEYYNSEGAKILTSFVAFLFSTPNHLSS